MKPLYAVRWLSQVQKDAEKAGLNEAALAQVNRQVHLLESWGDANALAVADLVRLKGEYRDIFELRIKGGAVGKTNLRVFFAVLDAQRAVVVLGIKKKERSRGIEWVYDTMLDRLECVRHEMTRKGRK